VVGYIIQETRTSCMFLNCARREDDELFHPETIVMDEAVQRPTNGVDHPGLANAHDLLKNALSGRKR
jgi:hypothetical protein